NTSGSAEDSLKLKEFMEIVPKLESKIDNLETELMETKQTLGTDILTLVKKMKSLEMALDYMEEKEVDFVTPTKVSASRKAQEEEISPTVLEAAQTLSQVVSQTVSTYKRRARVASNGKNISTSLDAEVKVNPGSADVNTRSTNLNTGSTPISTPSMVQRVNVIVHSPIKGQREGKEPMTSEDVQASKRTKAQIQQEEAGLIEAMRLQSLKNEEIERQVNLNALLAKRILEEQELSEQ
ncbi:hypothetical protein Tco_0844152, partial [Tanacetum coccineum]